MIAIMIAFMGGNTLLGEILGFIGLALNCFWTRL